MDRMFQPYHAKSTHVHVIMFIMLFNDAVASRGSATTLERVFSSGSQESMYGAVYMVQVPYNQWNRVP